MAFLYDITLFAKTLAVLQQMLDDIHIELHNLGPHEMTIGALRWSFHGACWLGSRVLDPKLIRVSSSPFAPVFRNRSCSLLLLCRWSFVLSCLPVLFVFVLFSCPRGLVFVCCWTLVSCVAFHMEYI